jgi:DNA-binding transcriptional ArsR family regulator
MLIHLQRLELKAKLFRGFADPIRLSILKSLREGEKTTSEIVKEVNQSQSNVSCLLDCGLVKNRRQGKKYFVVFITKRFLTFWKKPMMLYPK